MWLERGPDRRALIVLAALPLAVFALPALLGHSVLLGDDLTQNYPLRVLVGTQIRHGHLPLFDPYIWSGAPLLGGWNAGAAYPLTLLFVILPGSAAWALNLVATWWVAGIGCFVFLRASRLASVPSFLGAFSFSFAGSMIVQIVHFGLVAGASWIPIALLALLRLSETAAGSATGPKAPSTARRSWLGWTAVLGVAGAMNILAGEPRAITDMVIVVGLYALWRAMRLGHRAGPYLVWVAGGMLLAVALGAIQWLPGTDAVSTSQRAVSTTYLFTSGSLPTRWLALLLVPDVLGGSGSFGQPTFLASYNLTEVTGYVGLMPLVASFALLGRLRWRRPVPEWLVWEVVALVGIVLALGGNTPLWHLLVRIPLFGSQRLQSRNILIADMGFAFLLAYWSDAWLTGKRSWPLPAAPAPQTKDLVVGPEPTAAARTRETAPSTAPEPTVGSVYGTVQRILGALPALLAVTTVVVGIAWGSGLLRWFGATLRAATADGGLRMWFLPFGFLGLAAAALVLRGHHLSPSRRARVLVAFVVVDLLAFTFLTFVEVAPNFGRSSPEASSATTTTTTLVPEPAPGASVPTPPTEESAVTFTGSGRFAIYDPNLFNGRGLNVIGAPDLNTLLGVGSLQGYSSIVDGVYADATGSHQATGLGQDILAPGAVGDGTLDQLDPTALFAPRDYFLIDVESDPATPAPSAGERRLGPGGLATWYLGEDLEISRVVVPDANAAADARSGLRLGLANVSGKTAWAPAVSVGAHIVSVTFPSPQAAVALVARGGTTRSSLGPPSVTSEDGTLYTADGQLEGVVVPPRWTFRGFDGSFAIFADRFSRHPLTLRGSEGATIRATAGPAFAPSSAVVSSSRGVEVIRSESAIPGWTATWRPDDGSPVALRVHRVGLVQAVDVPAGHGQLSWDYDPPGWTAGWILSACGLAVLVCMLSIVVATRREPFGEGRAIERRKAVVDE